VDQSQGETWNVYLAVCPLRPHDLNRRRKFGSKSKPFELLCCAQVKTFPFIISVISWCESWMCEWRKWEIANIWRQNFTFDRKLAFPPWHLLDAKLSKIQKNLNNILREICMNGNWATNWYFLALSVGESEISYSSKAEYNLSCDHCRNLQSKWYSDHRMRWWYEYGGRIGLTIIWWLFHYSIVQ